MAAIAPVKMPTKSEIFQWTTTHLDEAATAWEKSAEQSENAFKQHVDNVRSPGGTEWTGQGASAAYDDAREAQDVVNTQCSIKRECARIARRGSGDIQGAKRTTISAIEDVEGKGYKVAEDLTVTDASTGGTDAERAARKAEAQQLTEYLRWHAQGLAATDEKVAGELTAEAQGLEGRKLSGDGTTQMLDDKTTTDGELPLYGPDGKPHPGDVMQRDVGDCYFEAAEIAVADKHPERIKDMIYKMGGDYYVTGMQDRFGNPIQDYRITDKDIQAVLAHHPDQKVLWPAILEAAAAKTRGGGDTAHGLELMGGGDMPGVGLKQLTGSASYTWFPGGGRDENDLINALNSGKPVVMGTSMSATPIGVDPHRDGLAASHVYALSSAHRDPDGTVWAEIINPWQFNMAQGDSGIPLVRIDPDTPGRAWLNLSGALSHHGVTAFVQGG